MSDIEAVTQSALQSIQGSTTLDELDQLRVNLLGKSGSITNQLKQLGALPPDQRRTIAKINTVLGEKTRTKAKA